MKLEQAIHERWAATGALSALLPADRLKTGLARGAAVPYATLVRTAGRTLCRTNAGDALDEVTLTIHVWHDAFDAAAAIAHQVKAAFDRSAFDAGGGDRVVQMRRAGESVAQHGDGVWQWTIEFSVQVYLASGC